MARSPVDKSLVLTNIPVNFLDGNKSEARAEGNNAAWMCSCGDASPLVGRCCYQFNDACYTI